jgi:hypothetical protein
MHSRATRALMGRLDEGVPTSPGMRICERRPLRLRVPLLRVVAPFFRASLPSAKARAMAAPLFGSLRVVAQRSVSHAAWHLTPCADSVGQGAV